jgi:hypothetical protein
MTAIRRSGLRAALRLSTATLVVGVATVSIAVLPAQVAGASPLTVTNCNDSGPGSLRDTVSGASGGDSITFALSPACSLISLTSGEIEISQNLTITGPGSSTLSVSGTHASRVFDIEGAAVSLSDLTIENGDAAAGSDSDFTDGTGGASGGGILVGSGTLTLTDCDVTDNSAGRGGNSTFGNGGSGGSGGGIDNEGTLVLDHSAVTDNDAGNGGGATAGGNGGQAGDGGGIWNQGSLQATDSTITGNVAGSAGSNDGVINGANGGNGGGIASDGPTTTLNFVTVSGNSAGSGAATNDGSGGNGGSGGGVWSDVKLELGDSTITANHAGGGGSTTFEGSGGTGGSGGGVWAEDQFDTFQSTIADNDAGPGGFGEDANGGAGGSGGGIWSTATVTFSESTLADNLAGAGGGAEVGSGGNGGDGGGLWNGGSGGVDTSTISGNTAGSGGGTVIGTGGNGGSGGGILNQDSLFLTFVTLSGDAAGARSAGGTGGTGGEIDNTSLLLLEATIVANGSGGGSGGDCANIGTLLSEGFNLADDGTCPFSPPADVVDTPAGLDPGGLADNGGPTQTIALLPGSAAIGLVSADPVCTGDDQRGVFRPVPCDAGSYQTKVTVTPTTVPDGTAETPYPPLHFVGGDGPGPFMFSSSVLPAGLMLTSAGVLRGTPTVAGTFSFTVTATGSDHISGTRQYSITLAPPDITVNPPTVTNPTFGVSSTTTFSATGGGTAYSFTESGALPHGLTFNTATGTISGTPDQKSQIGVAFAFSVTATDVLLFTGTTPYSITVGSPCGVGLTPYLLAATSRTGSFSGVFCLNVFGTGTYTQGAVTGTGTITASNGVTHMTAFGKNLALLGQKTTTTSTFTETAPPPVKGGTFTLN